MTTTVVAADLVAAAQALCPDLRAAAEAIDRERQLPSELVDRMVDAGLARMLVPRDVGGLQVDPLTATRVVETISAANGSAGWVLMIMAGTAHWAACWLPQAAAAQALASRSAPSSVCSHGE